LGSLAAEQENSQWGQKAEGGDQDEDCQRCELLPDWQVGDKTGSGNRTSNDIAIIRPPNRKPIMAAVYLTDTKVDAAGRDKAIADVGRVIADLYR